MFSDEGKLRVFSPSKPTLHEWLSSLYKKEMIKKKKKELLEYQEWKNNRKNRYLGN